MADMMDIEKWLIKCGWEKKDFWWMNPRYPGKKFDWIQAVRIQKVLEQNAGMKKEVPYWKTRQAVK